MNNNANTPTPLSPEESYLASKLFGRSLFSAIQLSKEKQRMEELQHQEADDILRVPIPVQKMGEEKQATETQGEPPGIIGRALRFNRNPIRTFVGAESGFSEAKRQYFENEKTQIQKALRQAQEEYLSTLQQIKRGEETPLVDAFCNGIATQVAIPELAKEAASAEDAEIGDGSVKRLLKKVLGVAAKPIQPALDLGATSLLGTAGGAGYLTYVLKKKLRDRDDESYLHSQLPTRVELEPYNLK
jgi:hypothetical protein